MLFSGVLNLEVLSALEFTRVLFMMQGRAILSELI